MIIDPSMQQLFDSMTISFDGVVMLTNSGWKADSREDLYHYVIRFALLCPVIFIRADQQTNIPFFEESGCENIAILHVPINFDEVQSKIIASALTERRVLRPLIWTDSPNYLHAIETIYSPIRIYHAVVDSFSSRPQEDVKPDFYLNSLFPRIDLLVASSQQVLDSYTNLGGYRGKTLLLKKPSDNESLQAEQCLSKKSASPMDDYDILFSRLSTAILQRLQAQRKKSKPYLNILFLYDANSVYIPTVNEYLVNFAEYSQHRFYFANATDNSACNYNMARFDVIFVHYSVRLCYENHISLFAADELKNSGSYKILFIQDEYENTECTRRWLDRIGFHAIFTCISENQARRVYSLERFRSTELIPTLTGFVPPALEHGTIPSLASRPIVLGYRGRKLPFRYGRLAYDKYQIGLKMREICEKNGVVCDIEWDEEKRFYKDDWYKFLKSCRATLGSESGSNVFDFDGALAALDSKKTAHLSFEEFHERYLGPLDGAIKMNQISPRIFEAIACGTALVLFEGEYSGIVKPVVHYIPLKKDFSNAMEVLEQLKDIPALELMTKRAYQDIIASGLYSHKKFVEDVDDFLDKRVYCTNPWSPLSVVVTDIRRDAPSAPEFPVRHDQKGDATSRPLSYVIVNEVREDSDTMKLIKKFTRRPVYKYAKFFVTGKIRLFNPLLRKIKNKLVEIV